MCILWLLICFVFLLLFLPSLFFPLLVFFGKSSLENGWQGINVIVAILVLIATVAAAIAAIYSFRVSRRILYYQLLARYSSSEMCKALDIMWELFDLRSVDEAAFLKVVKKYHNKEFKIEVPWEVVERNIAYKQIFYHRYEDINQARRQVSHFFQTTFEMFSKSKVLDKASFQELCAYNSFKLMYNVVEWFEVANATSWEFDPEDQFTELLEQSGRKDKDIKDLKGQRPPERTWDKLKDKIEQMMESEQK